MILDHFAGDDFTLDRTYTYPPQGDHPFKPYGLWVSVRGDDDWESWCNDNEYGIGPVRHTVTLTDTANIHHITTPEQLDTFYTFWHIPDDRYDSYVMLRPGYINWEAFTKTCDGIIIAPYIWSRRTEHMWYHGWDCASGCIWNLAAIAAVEPARCDA